MSNKHPDNTAAFSWPNYIDPVSEQTAKTSNDFFLEEEDIIFAGKHLIVDFWGVKELNNITMIETTLREAIEAANATLLHIHLHHFTPNGGVSGVAVLAESHISIHTWPEHRYAALDIFMCGNAEPLKALDVLQKNFKPTRSTLHSHKRGVLKATKVNKKRTIQP